MNIFDYLEMRGDLTFSERPFNEIDNLVFSVLAYLDMNEIVTDEFVFDVSLKSSAKDILNWAMISRISSTIQRRF